jgi:hypothetical protein
MPLSSCSGRRSWCDNSERNAVCSAGSTWQRAREVRVRRAVEAWGGMEPGAVRRQTRAEGSRACVRERETEARGWVDDQACSGDGCDAARRATRETGGALLLSRVVRRAVNRNMHNPHHSQPQRASRSHGRTTAAEATHCPPGTTAAPISPVISRRSASLLVLPSQRRHCPTLSIRSALLHLQLRAADQNWDYPRPQMRRPGLLLHRPRRQTCDYSFLGRVLDVFVAVD